MFRQAALFTLLVAALGACTVENRMVAVDYDACHAYGFRVGTAEYRLCQDREAAARRTGRSQAWLVADARAACESYGLTRYTDRYDQCVRDEYAARHPI
jgi:hypothetical protein